MPKFANVLSRLHKRKRSGPRHKALFGRETERLYRPNLAKPYQSPLFEERVLVSVSYFCQTTFLGRVWEEERVDVMDSHSPCFGQTDARGRSGRGVKVGENAAFVAILKIQAGCSVPDGAESLRAALLWALARCHLAGLIPLPGWSFSSWAELDGPAHLAAGLVWRSWSQNPGTSCKRERRQEAKSQGWRGTQKGRGERAGCVRLRLESPQVGC